VLAHDDQNDVKESDIDIDNEINNNVSTSMSTRTQTSKKNDDKKPEKDRVRDLDWARVAELLENGRKSAECLRRYNKICGHRGSDKAVAVKGPWTAEEDKKVIELVGAHGAKKWSQIAAELPGKYNSFEYAFRKLIRFQH
jgi:hypothetical protein